MMALGERGLQQSDKIGGRKRGNYNCHRCHGHVRLDGAAWLLHEDELKRKVDNLLLRDRGACRADA